MAQYRKGEKIDSGGFGIVYRATYDGHNDELAWKETRPDASDEEIRRFKREVRMQHQLAHPYILPILAYHLERASPVFIMPYADHSLRNVIESLGADHVKAMEVFVKICSGVSHAHQQGIIHRDLKPENVLFVRGEPKVSDFGLGRELDRKTTTITQTNISMGTLAYMAPEQMGDAKNVDRRADIYALGKILYEILTGQIPYPVMDTSALDGGYRYVVERATRVKPDERFLTVDNLINEVTLLTENRDLLLPGIVIAEQIASRASLDPTGANVEELVRMLIAKIKDEQLYQQIVPRLPEDVIAVASTAFAHEFDQILIAFCEHVSGSLAFSYVDVVSDFLTRAFRRSSGLDAKRAIIERLICVGPEHNRWHVRDVVRGLVGNLKSEDDIMLFRDAVVQYPQYQKWFDFDSVTRVPEVIRLAVQDAKQEVVDVF